MAGEQKDFNIVKKFMDAYEHMNPELIINKTT